MGVQSESREVSVRDAAGEELPATLRRVRDEDFGYAEARHLLQRAAFGGTPAQVETLASWGVERSVDFLLDVESIGYEEPAADAFDKDIMRPLTREERRAYARARRDQNEDELARLRRTRQQRQRDDRRQMGEIQRWWLGRLVESPRPLEEKMTLFWHGHFATSYRTIENSYHMYVQNQFFRRHALGSYAALMHGIIRDPAMLAYLDNNDSRKDRPNENLARELMELFGLGVGNYTERDIKEGARALTGYTFEDDEFRFVERNHDRGNKRILGRSGDLDGDGFVAAILARPACAEFMAGKLYDAFVLHLTGADSGNAEDPGVRGAVRRMAGRLRSSGYEIRPVLRELFLSEHFYHPRVMNRRIKSPVELVAGTIRALRTPGREPARLLTALDLMGQRLMFPPSVKGWDGGRSWINTSTLFVRQNAMNYLLTGQETRGRGARGDVFDPTPVLRPLAEADPSAARDAGRVTDYVLRFMLGQSPAHARATLGRFSAEHGDRVTPDLVAGMMLLITAMPEYQLC